MATFAFGDLFAHVVIFTGFEEQLFGTDLGSDISKFTEMREFFCEGKAERLCEEDRRMSPTDLGKSHFGEGGVDIFLHFPPQVKGFPPSSPPFLKLKPCTKNYHPLSLTKVDS